MADKFDANSWDKSPSYQNGGDVPWSRGIDLTPEQKMIAGKNIGIVTDAQIDSLIDQFHDLDGRVNVALDNVDTALETVSSLSGDVETALTGAQQALDTVNTITANFDVLSGKVDSNAVNISSNSADISTNSSNIGTLSAKEQIDRTDINAISGNVGTNAYNIGNLSAKVNTISGNVNTLQSDVSSIKIDITGMNSRLNTVSGIADNALASGQDALNKANAISAQWTVFSGVVSSEVSGLKDDWSAFSAAEDAVITAATAAIPGQVSAEVSGQLSGKQDKLTPGVNISISNARVIDVKNNACSTTGDYAIALGYHTSAIAYGSFAEGANTRAYGSYSHATGEETIASGAFSHTEGFRTQSNGKHSHAEGTQTTAAGTNSHSEGRNSIAQGNYSHADGDRVSAVGPYSHAMGKETLASGQYSFAVGNYARALGDESFANGILTRAIGDATHAEGYVSSAISNYSHAEGQYTISDTVGQHVEGQYNAPATGALHVIGNGSATTARSNIVETYTDRVVVNGDLIASGYNLNKAAEAMNDFMFDNATPTGNQAVLKLNTNDWQIYNTAYSAYTKKYDRVFVGDIRNPTVGNTQMCGIKNLTAGPVGIVDWKGDISRACWGSTTAYNRNNVSSWPSTIPTDVPNVLRLFSENSYMTSVDQIPTNFIEATSGKSKERCFQRCQSMRGDITPYIAAFSAEPTEYTYAMFGRCSAVDNYDTLSTAYPNFFADPG